MPLPDFFRRFFARASFWRWVALFLVVTGVRFILIDRFSNSVPFWDQWDAEADALIKHWLEGEWGWHALFAPHNEHRIVLTRLTALALLVLNGQWDPTLEMAVNAVFWAAGAVLMGLALTHAFGGGFRRTILVVVTLYSTLPFGWENTLCGFQSQTYYLILFSLVAVWGLGTGRAASAAWWTGLVGAGLACLSMGSGFLAAAAVLALLGWRCLRERRAPVPGEILTLFLCAGITALGWFTRVEVSLHEGLRAESPRAFVAALGRFLAWPLGGNAWLGLLAVVPLGWLAVVDLRQPVPGGDGSARRRTDLLLGAGGWVVLQALALALGRGGHEAQPASRYLDVLAIGTLANVLAWPVLLSRAGRVGGLRWVAPGAAAWLLLLAGQGRRYIRDDFQVALPLRIEQMRRSEENVRGYIATKDFERFLNKEPMDDIPYPDPERLAELLDDPTLRPIFPADIRAALSLCPVGAGGGGSGFVPDGFRPTCPTLPDTRVWGSYTPQGEAAQGEFHAVTAGPARLPYVRMFFAGDARGPGMRFSLWGEDDDGPGRWRPGGTTLKHWRTEYFHLSARSVLDLTATDRSATRWFAFTEPVEVGAWSYWSGYVLRRGVLILVLGLALGLGLEIAPLFGRRKMTKDE